MIPDDYLEIVLDIWTEGGEKHTCMISGNSMSPLIRQGDYVVVDYGNKDIRIGDVVIFKTPDKILAHRLIHKTNNDEGEVFFLKGDHCKTLDQPITTEKILGKVIEASGSNGHIYFNSFSWRLLNYFFSFISYASQKDLQTGSIFWKQLGYLFALGRKILPIQFSIRCALIKGIFIAHKIKICCKGYDLRKKRRNI